jgi:abortive infection bacteriophage resistance protein
VENIESEIASKIEIDASRSINPFSYANKTN